MTGIGQARVAHGAGSRGAEWIGELLHAERRVPDREHFPCERSRKACESKRFVSQRVQILVWLVLSLTMLFALRASVVETFYVPSASMSPTIQPAQHLVVPKITYGVSLPFMSQRLIEWSSPRRGDIVVFRRRDDPATEADEGARAMVKRVAAVGGDTVEIAGAEVVINGEPVVLAGKKGGSRDTDTDRDAGVPGRRLFRVPPDSVFVLGDNREHSFDSRYWEDPFVRVSQVVGPVIGVY